MKSPSRGIIAAACAVALGMSIGFLPDAHADKTKLRIAVVDIERCVSESEEGLRASAALKKFRDRRQIDIQTIEMELKAEDDKLRKDSEKGMTPELTERVRTFKKKLEAYQATLRAANEQISVREQQLYGPIETKLKQVLAKIAQADGWDLILDKKQTPMAAGERDLTDRVVREFDGGASAAPSASASAKP